MGLSITTFHNVTISIPAKTPQEAYTKLCDILHEGFAVDWFTDTYSTEDDATQRDTAELFPDI